MLKKYSSFNVRLSHLKKNNTIGNIDNKSLRFFLTVMQLFQIVIEEDML